MWDLRDKACEFQVQAAHDSITAIGRVGSRFFTTGKDGLLRVWDTAMRKVVNAWDFEDRVMDAIPIGSDKILLGAGSNLTVSVDYIFLADGGQC